MKRGRLIKKIAMFIASLSMAACACYFVPQIIYSIGETTQVAEENGIAPEIVIDVQGYDLQNAPNAVVGKEYHVFKATAKDNQGEEVKVAQKVWLYYYSSTKARVEIQNGVFIPMQAGEYVVEYTAMDRYGNKASATYEVDCFENSGLSLSFDEQITTGVAGIELQVPEVLCQNVSGIADVKVQAIHKDGKEVQNISENLVFRPMYAGIYSIEYIVSDYISTVTTSYEIVVNENATPLFLDEPNIPKYFVQNKIYQLDVPDAYHFSFGVPSKLIPVITVEYDKGQTITIENGTFTPTVAGDIVVKYTISYAEEVKELIYKATVVNVDYGQLNSYNKYFYSEDYSTTLTNDCVELFTIKDNAEIDFINPVLARNAYIAFTVNTRYKNFTAVEMYLTDSVDSSIQVKFLFQPKQNGGTTYTINDDKTYGASVSLFSGEKVELKYQNASGAFSLNSGLDVFVRQTLSGEDFIGFPSQKMNITIRLVGVDGPAGLCMYTINNQNFSMSAMDSSPEIIFTRHESGEMKVGDVITLNPFYVGDVLDYDSIIKFYVLDPKGNFVTALDGTLLDGNVDYMKTYFIFMEMTGNYNVCMEISDSMDNKEMYAYGIKVVDRTPPKIVLQAGSTAYKCGDTVEIWAATATDSEGNNVDVYVYVSTPEGRVEPIQNGRFYVEKTGKYKIYYQAFDAAGNAVIESYEIVVS